MMEGKWQLRQQLYQFFAGLLLCPLTEEHKEVLTEVFWQRFPLQDENERLLFGLQQMKSCIRLLSGISSEAAIQTVQVEYTTLFLGPGRPQAPLWESVYTSEEHLLFGPSAFELRKLFRQYGLESRQKYHQPEDHLGYELLLPAVASQHLAADRAEVLEHRLHEQREFLDRHLLSWLPLLYEAAARSAGPGYYPALLGILWGMLLWDRQRLEAVIK